MGNSGTVKEEMGGLKDRAVGNVKETVGNLTGNQTMQHEGSTQANYGAARQANNDVASDRWMTGSFRDRDSAERAYNSLLERGYSRDDVNVLMSDKSRETYFSDANTELGSKALEGAGAGSAIGGTLGAIIGGIAAIGTNVFLPGLGLIVAGPLAAALAGAGAGGLTGGLIGALIGAGIPEDEAARYEEDVKNGNIVMGFKPRNNEDYSYYDQEWRNNRY